MKIVDKELIEKTILEWENQQSVLQVSNLGFYVVPNIYDDARCFIYGGKRFSVITSPELIMTVSQNELKLINDHTCDIPKTYIESLFDYLNEKIFNIKKKDDDKEMNDKELISQKKLFQLVCEWLNPFIDEQIRLGGYWSSSLMVDSFNWHLNHAIGGDLLYRAIGSRLINDHWEIYNDIYKEENVNIKIFDNHIEFFENSKFKDFSKEEMHSLYTFLKERIFGIKEDEKKEEDNKVLISKDKLRNIMGNYIKPKLDECKETGGSWRTGCSLSFVFSWKLYDSLGYLDRRIAARLCNDHWEIYNNYYYYHDVNIKVFKDHVEFIEESDFDDFDKDFMYGLYMNIKEVVEGNNKEDEKKEEENKELLPDDEAFKLLLEWLYDYEKFLKEYLDPERKRLFNRTLFEIEEEINKMGVQNENNNEGSKFESAMNNYDGDVTKHRKSDEWDKMRAMVNGFHLPKKIDWDEINITNVEKPSKPYRPSKDHYYLNIAKEVAMRGTCLRRKFGAVIVNNDEIVSTGYVGAPRGRINCTDRGVCFRQENNIKPGTRYELCRSVHAEMNAVISAGRDRCIGATLYLVGIENDGSFTSNVDCCSMCKRVIINSGIEKVVFRTPVGQRTIHVKEDWINDDDSLTIHEGY